MSDELEKRLRELVKRHQASYAYHGDTTHHPAVERPVLLAMEAARIGAEIEREACAALLERDAESGTFYADRQGLADAIRARGGK